MAASERLRFPVTRLSTAFLSEHDVDPLPPRAPAPSCAMCWGQRVIWEIVEGTAALLPMACDACAGTGRAPSRDKED